MRHLLGILTSTACWYLCQDIAGLWPAMLVPRCTDVATQFATWADLHPLLLNGAATLLRWGCGFFSGLLAGLLCGTLISTSERLRVALEPAFEFMRGIPPTGLLPLFLLLFGTGDAGKISMSAFPTMLITLLSVCQGAATLSTGRREAFALLGASRVQYLRYAGIYEMLPSIFLGIRVTLSLSLATTVVAEMFIGASDGLGQQIYESYLLNAAARLYAALIVLGMLGGAANLLAVHVYKICVPWKPL